MFAKIDGGVAEIGYTGIGYDGVDTEEVFRAELEDREFDIAFSYGWGWSHHVYLPSDEPIKSDYIKIVGKDFYGYIDKIELNAPHLADVVNRGFESFDYREEDSEGDDYEEDDGEKFDEGMKREVVPMNGRKSFGRKAMEEDDGDGFTLFSYETPVARLERREDGSGMDFILLSDYLSSTTLTHIHSWLIGHNQKDIPTKKLLQMNVGDSVPMMAAESKKMFNEGAGAGYTVEIKGLKFGKIIDYKWEDSCKVKVEVVSGDYEIGAESYYDDFFWQEHEYDITPEAKIDGGYAIFDIGLNDNPDEDNESYREMVRELQNRELDISFMYGAGWLHANLPREKIVVDSVDIEGSDIYFAIDKLVLNAPDLADAVNCGYKSLDDRDEDSEDEESVDESYIGDKVKDGWNKVKDGAKKLKTKIGDMFNGPFRRGERVEMSGENGETVKGTIMGFDLGDKTYTVLLGRDEY